MNDSVFASTVVGGKEVYSKKEGFKGSENLSGCRFLVLNQLFTFDSNLSGCCFLVQYQLLTPGAPSGQLLLPERSKL